MDIINIPWWLCLFGGVAIVVWVVIGPYCSRRVRCIGTSVLILVTVIACIAVPFSNRKWDEWLGDNSDAEYVAIANQMGITQTLTSNGENIMYSPTTEQYFVLETTEKHGFRERVEVKHLSKEDIATAWNKATGQRRTDVENFVLQYHIGGKYCTEKRWLMMPPEDLIPAI